MFSRKKTKIFCIGRNKTGTTSLAAALQRLGYRLGDQPRAELLIEEWAKRDFRHLIKMCRRADAFQDIPFSLDFTFAAMDQAFPGSRFILTVRDSPEQWFESLTRFHAKLLATEGTPTAADLKAATYRAPGWLWRVHQLVHGADESSVYDPIRYMRHYEEYNARVRHYFRHRPADLLVLNLSENTAMDSLCRFLGIPAAELEMPHLNRSA